MLLCSSCWFIWLMWLSSSLLFSSCFVTYELLYSISPLNTFFNRVPTKSQIFISFEDISPWSEVKGKSLLSLVIVDRVSHLSYHCRMDSACAPCCIILSFLNFFPFRHGVRNSSRAGARGWPLCIFLRTAPVLLFRNIFADVGWWVRHRFDPDFDILSAVL